jgi:hypothetical protein
MKLILSLLLFASIAFSAVGANATPYTEFEKKYAELVKLSNNLNYVYRLTPNEIAAAYDVKDQRHLLNILNEKISDASGRRDNFTNWQMALKREDFEKLYVVPLVDHITTMAKAQINLAILTLSRDALMNENKRIAARLILTGIGEKKFNQAELDRIAKADTYGAQANKGSTWGAGIAATIGAIFYAKKNAPGVVSEIKSLWSKAPKLPSIVKAKAVEIQGLSLKEAMQMARASGVRFSTDVSSAVVDIVTRQNKFMRLKMWGKNITKSQGFKDVAWFALAMGTGAAGNTGYHALHKIFFKENMSNGIINPIVLRDEYFDGLSILRLSCKVKEALPKAIALSKKPISKESSAELKIQYRQLLDNYADFMYLKDAVGGYERPTQLAKNITLDSATGRVSFKVKLRGQVQVESFECPALKGVKTHPVEVSLGEILDELTESFVYLEGSFFKYQI